jgi:molybdopterin molybdotransferase
VTNSSTTSFAAPYEALAALLSQLRPVSDDRVPCLEAAGRVLAQPITADRDSPPCDNSAMDGYAVRLADVRPEAMTVAGEVSIGCPPPVLPMGQALRIVTGAPLPAGAEAVIRREDVEEQGSKIIVRPGIQLQPGQHIRRQGENVRQGETVLAAGRVLDAAAMTAATTFGAARLRVYRQVRVAVIVTGNELRPPESPVSPWELRDSNGPALGAMLSGLPWLAPPRLLRAKDDFMAITHVLEQCLADCDAVLLTGGVSMGQHDHVPDAVAAAGGKVVFRRLPIRPGHPLLAAVTDDGRAILGLPGNPVSVMVTARRFAAAVLRRLAGIADPAAPRPVVMLSNPDTSELPLWWFRPVRLVATGRVELLRGRGSADIVTAAISDGFVEIPPHSHGAGPWPFWRWTID